MRQISVLHTKLDEQAILEIMKMNDDRIILIDDEACHDEWMNEWWSCIHDWVMSQLSVSDDSRTDKTSTWTKKASIKVWSWSWIHFLCIVLSIESPNGCSRNSAESKIGAVCFFWWNGTSRRRGGGDKEGRHRFGERLRLRIIAWGESSSCGFEFALMYGYFRLSDWFYQKLI